MVVSEKCAATDEFEGSAARSEGRVEFDEDLDRPGCAGRPSGHEGSDAVDAIGDGRNAS